MAHFNMQIAAPTGTFGLRLALLAGRKDGFSNVEHGRIGRHLPSLIFIVNFKIYVVPHGNIILARGLLVQNILVIYF